MTQIDLLREDLDSTGYATVSPVPDLVRVAVVGPHRQIDLSLPLDVPVALLVPEVVRLFDGAAESRSGGSTTPPVGAEERPKDVVWVLAGAGSGAPLAPDDTLRGAGVGQDDVLYLRGRRTLAAPTLYDDVVDAAAHLNQSGHAGWDPSAARHLAHLGVGLAAAAWVYLVLVDASSPRRAVLLGLSAFVTVTLLVVATVFARSGRAPQSGAALGWASLPISAAGCWAGLSPYGSLALAGGALALTLLCATGYRLIGAGAGGFTAGGAFFICAAIALAMHAAGLTRIEAAAGLAVGATVATLAVPRMTARFDYARSARPEPTDSGDDLARRVALARSVRRGLSAGLAVGACSGAATVVWAAPTPTWPSLAFGMVCAAALGLPRPTTQPGVARAAAGLPAIALVVAAAFAAVRGDAPVSLTGAATLLAGAIVLAVIGSRFAATTTPHPRWRALLAPSSYLAYALIGPSALWVVGAQPTWGVW